MREDRVLPVYPQPALLERSLDLVFPPVCVGCRRRVGRWICADCWKDVRWIQQRKCFECGRPSPTVTCVRCSGKAPSLERLIAVAQFEGTAREAVHHLKFHHHHAISSLLGRLMAGAASRQGRSEASPEPASVRSTVASEAPDSLADAHSSRRDPDPFAARSSHREFDLVAHIPLHPRRRRERGYDQSALLARVIARNLSLPLALGALQRTRRTEQQAILQSAARISNVRGAFKATAQWDRQSILLVDDVSTTGATIQAAATALRDAGVASVTGLVFAH